MAGNTLGRVFTVTSFGESHGPAIGCVVDGCPRDLHSRPKIFSRIWIGVNRVPPVMSHSDRNPTALKSSPSVRGQHHGHSHCPPDPERRSAQP